MSLVLAMIGFGHVLPTLLHVPAQRDFAAYYLSARVLNAGGNLYDATAMQGAAMAAGVLNYTGYIYLPLVAILFRPLAAMPYPTASTIWFLFNIGLAIVSMTLLGKALRLPTSLLILLVCGYLLLPATYDTLLLGQLAIVINALLVGVLLVSGWPNRHSRSDITAGVLLGAAVVLKIYPVVLGLVYLLHRRIRVLLSMLMTILLSLTLGIVLGGWNSTWQWLSVVLPSTSAGSAYPANQSIWGVTERLFRPHFLHLSVFSPDNYVFFRLVPIVDSPFIEKAAAYAAAGFLILMSIILIRRMSRTEEISMSLSVGIALMLLISPIAWDNYLVHLVLPLLLISDRHRTTPYRTVGLMVCLLMLLQRCWRPMLLYVPSALLTMFGFTAVVTIWFTLWRIALKGADELGNLRARSPAL